MLAKLNYGGRGPLARGAGARALHLSARRPSRIRVGLTNTEIDPSTVLPFGQLKKQEYGELVDESAAEDKVSVISNDEMAYADAQEYYDEAGNRISSKQARMDPRTLRGKVSQKVIKLPRDVADVIKNNIQYLYMPKGMKLKVSKIYEEFAENGLHLPVRRVRDVDAHILAFFLQNYASVYQALYELKKRYPEFSPDRVLDVGYGPATGMVALNELMGHEFKPSIKDAVMIGAANLQDRAKILLSRQVNEYTGDIEDLVQDVPEHAEAAEKPVQGPVKTHKIKIRTKLYGELKETENKQYDLIIATHQLLQDQARFPLQVDMNVQQLLKKLAPGGHLVLIEKGSPLGFETIARARQFMIRPENFPSEVGKVPRPWTVGSVVKPKNRADILDDIDVEIDDDKFIRELEEKYGQAKQSELELESAVMKDAAEVFEMHDPAALDSGVDYHLSVVAPCTHHHKCPLQTGKPAYYNYGKVGNLKWCSFEQHIERPTYVKELKRGKILSQSRETMKKIGESGRAGANSVEVARFSYLIMQRSANDQASLDQIKQARSTNGAKKDEPSEWARIMYTPTKSKGHVMMGLCTNDGAIEKWTVTKAFSSQGYTDARKSQQKDLWGLDAKVKIRTSSNVTPEKLSLLKRHHSAKIKEAGGVISKEAIKQKLKDVQENLQEMDKLTLERTSGLADPEQAIDYEKFYKGYVDAYHFNPKTLKAERRNLKKVKQKMQKTYRK